MEIFLPHPSLPHLQPHSLLVLFCVTRTLKSIFSTKKKREKKEEENGMKDFFKVSKKKKKFSSKSSEL